MKSVRALVFTQKDVKLYCFTMSAVDFEPLCYVEAAARDREKGIQRVTEVSRLREIGEFLATGENSFLPNNIIVNLKPLGITPLVTQNDTNRASAIDGRTTCHEGYAVSQRKRKRVEEVFG